MPSRLEKRLMNLIGRASGDFDLIEPGDRIMVAISGGKDSWAMLHLLRATKAKVPFDFDFIAVNLDQGQPGFQGHVITDYLDEHGYPYKMVAQDTYSVVTEKIPEGKTYCSLCSRMRRGILYNTAVELGCNKIALGHHRDDSIETLMLNLLYSGQIKAMPPRLTSDDGRNIVIRPLIYCAEDDIAAFAQEQAFPILPCDLCGSQDNLYRKRVKNLLTELSADNNNVRGNLLAALSNVKPSHLLDKELRAAVSAHEIRGDDESIAQLEGDAGVLGCSL